MTFDRYAHALPERDREAAGLLGQVLEQATLGLTEDHSPAASPRR